MTNIELIREIQRIEGMLGAIGGTPEIAEMYRNAILEFFYRNHKKLIAALTAAPQPAQAGASGGGDAEQVAFERWARPQWGHDLEAFKIVNGRPQDRLGLCWEYNGNKVQAAWAAWIERAMLTSPAPPATGCTDWRNEAFNLADTVIEHIRCGQEQKARDAIMEAFTTSQTAATQGGEWVMVPERCLDGSMTIEEMVSAFIELHPGAKDYRHVFKLCATAAIKSAAPQPQEAVLDKPARVGATVFSAGVPCRLVIDRAQREQEWHENPPLPNADMAGLRKLLTTPPAHGDGEGERDDFWNAVCAWTWKHRGWSPAKCQADELRAALTTRPTPEAQEARAEPIKAGILCEGRSNLSFHALRPDHSAACSSYLYVRYEGRLAHEIDRKSRCKSKACQKLFDKADADAALALPAQGEGNNG